jgi:hypothetical protein
MTAPTHPDPGRQEERPMCSNGHLAYYTRYKNTRRVTCPICCAEGARKAAKIRSANREAERKERDKFTL